MCELKLHNVLPGFSKGKMPGRSTVEGGKEESEEEEVWRVDREVMNSVSAADLVNSTERGDVAGKVEETCGVKEAQSAMWLWSLLNMRVKVGIARRLCMSWRREM